MVRTIADLWSSSIDQSRGLETTAKAVLICYYPTEQIFHYDDGDNFRVRETPIANSFHIGERQIGGSSPTLIVAEVAQAHEGSVGMAHAFVDAAAQAKADAVKFQVHFAEQSRRSTNLFGSHFLARTHPLRLLATDGICPRAVE